MEKKGPDMAGHGWTADSALLRPGQPHKGPRHGQGGAGMGLVEGLGQLFRLARFAQAACCQGADVEPLAIALLALLGSRVEKRNDGKRQRRAESARRSRFRFILPGLWPCCACTGILPFA